MKTIYSLEHDTDAIASMQRASLEAGPFGLRITHGHIGSREWWSQVGSGALRLHLAKGTISGFWPGQWGDGPATFELQTKDDQRSMWLCRIDSYEAKEEFYIGRDVEVAFVVQQHKSALVGSSSDETNITVSISFP